MAQGERLHHGDFRESGLLPPDLRELLQPAETPSWSTIRQVNVPIEVAMAGKPLTDFTIDELSSLAFGCDTLYFLAVGPQSPHGLEIARKYAYEHVSDYPDLDPSRDLKASSFATTPGVFDPSIARSRDEWRECVYEPLRAMGISVILDLVPNHASIEEAMLHPEAFVTAGKGTAFQWKQEEYYREQAVFINGEERYVAHGAGRWDLWADTAQLNPYSPQGREYLARWLDTMDCCGGYRIDMAHLLLRREFVTKWQSLVDSGDIPYFLEDEALQFLREEAERRASSLDREAPGFICETYEVQHRHELAALGYPISYNHGAYQGIRAYVGYPDYDNRHEVLSRIGCEIQGESLYKSVRYPSNHDEPRGRRAFGEAAFAVTALLGLTPGGHFLHYAGEEEGRLVRPPQQIRRYPSNEATNAELIPAHRRVIDLRRSRIFQQGQGLIPDHSRIDPRMIAVGVENGRYSLVTCANVGQEPANGMIPLSGTNHLVGALDLLTGDWADQIDHNAGEIFVQVAPHGAQALFFDKES